MVVPPNTVAHPRTVVVHSFNAVIAFLAMMDPRQFDHITFLTVCRFLQLPNLLRAKLEMNYSGSLLNLLRRSLFLILMDSAL